jgi:outer membrane lipopolysaccharide assembly protein LptE/RlpB
MKINKIILIVLLFFQVACGYKIANNIDGYKFNISKYELKGEKKINNILERNFKRFQNNVDSKKKFNLKSYSNVAKTITSKNTSGDALTYEMKVMVEINLSEDKNLIKKINFEEKTDYNSNTSKFELKQYEDILLQDLTNIIIFNINNYLSSIK